MAELKWVPLKYKRVQHVVAEINALVRAQALTCLSLLLLGGGRGPGGGGMSTKMALMLFNQGSNSS